MLHPTRRDTLASEGRKILGGFSLPRLWRPPEDSQVITAASTDTELSEPEVTLETSQEEQVATEVPPPPVEPVLSPRQLAVKEVIQKLKEENVRINSTADTCGVSFHKEGGIAPLPEGDVEAGTTIDLTEGPHGDMRTKCRLATLPSLMKVCLARYNC